MPVENVESVGNDAQPHSIFWLSQSRPVLPVDRQPGALARAILSEIEESAARFAAVGEEASINLRCLKEMQEEREILATLLGHGEVSAVVEAVERSEIHETSIPCVWWVTHRNADGETIRESIEITGVPEVIVGDRKAISYGLETLRIAWPFRMHRLPAATANAGEK
ncbi:MAG TPA: hydrogenase expression/formation C-terminal domain-containing protein [Gallionella sp.]|nr:hydrogenase expression/formation C-terminal domain-containing protein [Gallionella sp.]